MACLLGCVRGWHQGPRPWCSGAGQWPPSGRLRPTPPNHWCQRTPPPHGLPWAVAWGPHCWAMVAPTATPSAGVSATPNRPGHRGALGLALQPQECRGRGMLGPRGAFGVSQNFFASPARAHARAVRELCVSKFASITRAHTS